MPTLILGINSAYHESSVALLRDGQLIATVAEERFNRYKHGKEARVDNTDELPLRSLQYCLDVAGAKLADVDHIGFSFLPEVRLERCVSVDADKNLPPGSWGTEAGERKFREGLLKIPARLSERAGVDLSERFHFLSHHLCHAASAFYPSEFEQAAVLVVDGIAESASTMLGHGRGCNLAPLGEIDYPNSLGFLWEKMSEYLGFSEYDACKVMGLASYGEAFRTMSAMSEILHFGDEGSFTVDDKIMKFRTDDFSELERVFGVPRRSADRHLLAVHENIAASLQQATEDALAHVLHHLHERTGSTNLAMAGGVALNCVANTKILDRTRFENIFVQPAAYDSGTAMGAAYLIHHQHLKGPRTEPMRHIYLGPSYTDDEIEQALAGSELDYKRMDQELELFTAKRISEGHIVAWFQGRMEDGPRALGNRSILADPRSPVLRDIINTKVKHREVFRPFCPSVLEARASEWFEIDRPQPPAYFMLGAYTVKPGKRELIPAVTHIDGTARIQLVNAALNERYHRLLSAFHELTGVPILMNTSFNVSEPIVCSPSDAITTFCASKMDYLVLGDFVAQHQGRSWP